MEKMLLGIMACTPRLPSTIRTRINGTKIARMGVCRPTIAPSRFGSSPVILPRVVIGTAIAPKATAGRDAQGPQ